MSFIYGDFDSDSLGLIATLQQLPSFGGLQLETLEAPGSDGLVFGGTTLSSAEYRFDVIIQGTTAAEAHEKRDELALQLDPARGQQWLQFDAAPGWRWLAILSSSADWQRLTWDDGLGYQLRGDVVFEALDAYGRLVEDETWEATGPVARTVQREKGNARSYPTLTLTGALTAAQHVTVTVGGVTVQVDGPLAANETLRLDWLELDFARWNGPTKVASVVRKMSNLDRPELWPREPSQFAVSTTGSVTSVQLHANSRRQ